MTTDLEADLRAALHAEAADAPVVTPEWPGPTIVPAAASRHPGRVLAIAAVLVLAVGAAGAVLALRRSASPAPGTHVRPSFLEGREFTIRAARPKLPAQPGHVVRPGSLRAYLLPDEKTPFTVYESALNDAYSREQQCAVFSGASVCIALPAGGVFLAGAADSSHVAWLGLPGEAAYVQLVARDGTATWQVPLDGIAALPDTPGAGDPRSLVAYDADGNVVIDYRFPTSGQVSTMPPFLPGIDEHPDRELELVDIGRAALNECLARISARPLPDAAWDACVDEGAAAMLARNAELDATS